MVGTIAAFLQSAAANRYAVAVCTEYRDLVAEKLYRTEYKYLMPIILLPYSIKSSEIWERSPVSGDGAAGYDRQPHWHFTYAVYIGETNLGLLMVILITYPLIFWIAGNW